MSSQIQRLDLEIQAFLDETYKYHHGVGACEIRIDEQEHGLTSKEISVGVYGQADGLARDNLINAARRRSA